MSQEDNWCGVIGMTRQTAEFDPMQNYGYYMEADGIICLDEVKAILTESQISRFIPEKYHHRISWKLTEPQPDTNYKWRASWMYTPEEE
jgi:hypothetical protein